METIERVMALYGMKNIKIIQMSDKLYKVDDGQQQYALKKSVLNHESVTQWERLFHHAYQQQLSSVLPLILTTSHTLFIDYEQSYYYLMPWINGEQATMKQLCQCIGEIHKQTSQSRSVDNAQVIRDFHQYETYCTHMQETLLSYVKRFESHVYMSPIELQICTHYRDVELVCKKNRNQMTQLTDQKGETLAWSYSLCHGNLERSHALVADQTYLINWEQTVYEHPITDIVTLFKQECLEYDPSIDMWNDAFKLYMDRNKLSNHELSLLMIHLLDPTNYMTAVQAYVDQTSHISHIHQVRHLQATYRQLIFALQFLTFIEENYLNVIVNDSDTDD